MRILVVICLLILLKPAPAQTFQWQQDSAGQWYINEAFFNSFIDTASDMTGNRIFFYCTRARCRAQEQGFSAFTGEPF